MVGVMGGSTRRPASASAAWLLVLLGCPVLLGCRGDPGSTSGSATEGDASSSGAELDTWGSTTAAPGACSPGQVRACYEGPPGTEGMGVCAAGQQRCAADGEGWSACEGQVWPEPAERCDTPHDDDCDGSSVCSPTLKWWQELPGLVSHVAARADGGVVVAGTDGYDDFQGVALAGMFVVALDASGERVWSRSTGESAYGWPGALAVDAAGAVVVAGLYDGLLDLGGGSSPFSELPFGAFAVRYAADGTHAWSHGFAADGYIAAALGPDGTTYLVGDYVFGDDEPELQWAQLYVAAITATGELAWTLAGHGSWSSSEPSLRVTDAGELWLVALAGGSELGLGALDMPTRFYEPLLVHIGLDGTPLGYRRLIDPLPSSTYDIQAFPRPGGVLAAATVTQESEGFATGVLLVALDEEFQPLSQHFLGDDTWLRAIAPYPDGTTVLSLDFSGLLALGPLGVGVDGPAIAVVDDEGRARWAEVLYSESPHTITSMAVAPDGAVLVGGYASDGGVLAGVAVTGSFVAKLRP